MNVLLFPVYPLTPEVEREMELARLHLDRGDRVFILRCTGQLPSCMMNIRHLPSYCTYCRAKYRSGLRAAHIPDACLVPLDPMPPGGYPDVRSDFEDIDDLMAYHWRGVDIGAAVASTLIWYCHKDHRFSPRKYAAMIARDLQAAAHTYVTARRRIEELGINHVYAFNGRHSTTRPVIRAARDLGVEWSVHERVSGFDRYVLNRGFTVHDIERNGMEMERLWDEADPATREEVGARFYIERRNRAEQGWFSFARQMEADRLPAGFDRSKRNIVLFNSTLQEMVGLEGWENKVYRDDHDAMRQLFSAFRGHPDIRFTLRMHPNMLELTADIHEGNNTQLRELAQLRRDFPEVNFIPPESRVDSYALLDASDLVVVFGSTIGAEACYWGIPSLACGSGTIYRRVGCTHNPATHAEVLDLIRNIPPPRPRIESLKYGFWEMTRGTPYRHFRQTGIFQGTFDGQRVHPGPAAILGAGVQRLFELVRPGEFAHFRADVHKYLKLHRPS